MPDTNINLNIKDFSDSQTTQRRGRAATSASATDPKLLQELKKLKDKLEPSAKKELEKLIRLLEKLIDVNVKESQKKSGAITKNDISKLAREAASKNFDTLIRSVNKVVDEIKKSDGGLSAGEMDKILNKHITKAINDISRQVARGLGSSLKISEAALAKELSKYMSRASSPVANVAAGGGKVYSESQKLYAVIARLVREISHLSKSVESARKSGGQVSVNEIEGVFRSLKRMTEAGKEAKNQLEDFSVSIKNAVSITKEQKKEAVKTITSGKKAIEEMVTAAFKKIEQDKASTTKEIVNLAKKIVTENPKIAQTEFGKIVKNLDGVSGDISKLINEFKIFQTQAKDMVKEGKLGKESYNQFLSSTERLLDALKKIPNKFELGVDIPPEFKTLEKHIKNFTDLFARFESVVVEVVADTKKAKEQIKKDLGDQKVSVGVEADTKKAEKDISSIPSKTNIQLKPSVSGKSLEMIDRSISESLRKASEKGLKGLDKDLVSDIKSGIRIHLERSNLEEIKKMLLDLSKELKVDFSEPINQINSLNAEARRFPIADKMKEAQKSSEEMANNFVRMRDAVKEVRSFKSSTQRNPSEDLKRLKQIPITRTAAETIQPSADPTGPRNLTRFNAKINKSMEASIKSLSKSLYKLQNDLVDKLTKTFKESESGWDVVREKGQKGADVFKEMDKAWAVQIADVSRMRKQLGYQAGEGSSKAVMEAMIQRKINEAFPATVSQQALNIGKWLKAASEKQIQNLDRAISENYGKVLMELKDRVAGKEIDEKLIKEIERSLGGGGELSEVYKATYGRTAAIKSMQQGPSPMLRTVSLPAAKVTEQGIPTFETAYGAQRAVPKFAKYVSGLEKVYTRLEESQLLDRSKKYAEQIKSIGPRPKGIQLGKAETLAREMLEDVFQSGKKDVIKPFYDQFKTAAVTKGYEVGKLKGGAPEEIKRQIDLLENKINGAIETFKTLEASQRNAKSFLDVMEKAGVSAYDVVKSMDKIEFENVYDVYSRILEGHGKVKPIKTLGEQPFYDRSIREFEKAVNQLEGTFPLIEPGRPRRAMHQANVLNLMSRTSTVFGEQERLGPQEQKDLIKDLNVRLKELTDEFKDLKAAGVKDVRGFPETIRAISSLGIPEAQAGNVQELRAGQYGEGTKYLSSLNATMLKMYTDTLAELSPLGPQFQQIGRNIASTTNALRGIGTEFPSLRSEREREVIKSGLYGGERGGYGFNVVAELRNTASTFEDQILVSGRLADAMTRVVKSKIFAGGEQATDVLKGNIKKLNESIDDASREIQKVLGVPVKMGTRADEALIEEVKKTISIVRGESVEVQQARIAETFLNYFGRKFTTRFGSKGVSVTPAGGRMDLAKALSQVEEGKGVKVLTKEEQKKAGLGAAELPKSMGQIAAEMLMAQAKKLREKGQVQKPAQLDELAKELIESGNKFMLDVFKNVEFEFVASDEAKKAQERFNKYASAMKEYFGVDVMPDLKGIEQLKAKYSEVMGEHAKFFEQVPIDIRISSYGAAKRGLQTEFLETIVGNLADVGKGGTTTLKNVLESGGYKKLLGGKGEAGVLSRYSEALGFKGTPEKDINKIVSEMMGNAYQAAFEEAKKREKGESFDKDLVKEYDKNMRAAILESISNYYSEIIDETGKRRLSLVGPKFVEIVEEPMATAEWTLGQVEKGIKGERLNLPAYASYAAIFGESSALMQEIQSSITENTKKHWEYLKALQVLNDDSGRLVESLTKGLPTVDISEFERFEGSTGTFEPRKMTNAMGEIVTNMNSFQDTILDISKYPSSLIAKIPTGKMTQTGELEKEPFYVPGALARGTYEEPLLPGQRGMDVIARRLVHVFNMAKELQQVLSAPGEFIEDEEVRKRLPSLMADKVKEFWTMVRKGIDTDEAKQAAQKLISDWFKALSAEDRVDPSISYGYQGTEQEYIADFMKRQLDKVGTMKPSGEARTELEAYAVTLSQMADLIVGPKKETATTPEAQKRLKGYSKLDKAVTEGTAGILAQRLGLDVSQEVIDKKVENLQKAKIEYYNTLAEAATGKGGAVEEVLFSRKMPAVMGKAITAVVDRTAELRKASVELQKLGYDLGESFNDEIKAINEIAKEHEKVLGTRGEMAGKEGLARAGIPILKQHEIGVPIEFAKKIPVEFSKRYKESGELMDVPEKITGTLFNMLSYIEKLEENFENLSKVEVANIKDYIEKDLVPYVESVRYPFTGVSSVQPYRAKLIKDPMAKGTLVAPGIPELDKDALDKVVDNLRDSVERKMAERESARTRGDDIRADELTQQINKLNNVISNLIPKYIAHQQKLDFDGDQIEIHSAKTKEARQEIAEHMQRVKTFRTTTSDIFRDKFTSEAVQPSTGQYLFAEASKSFEKKFPYERGFEFLKTPFLEEQVRNLDLQKVVEVLGKRQKTDPTRVIENVVRDIVQNKETMSKIAAKLKEVPQTKESTPEDAASALEALTEALKGTNDVTMKMAEEALRNTLFMEKYQDAIEAQLFKVHTGTDTEALYRLTRVAEMRTGFGAGLIRGEQPYKATEKFKARNPAEMQKILGVDPGAEFQTMMNEVLRFAIQKGMDVKHAGDIPVAGEIVKLIASGSKGVQQLWSRIYDKNDETFKELKEFAEASKKAIEINAGEYSTEELRDILVKTYEARGLDASKISGVRSEIIDAMVEQFGLKGFLNELSNVVYEEAVDGMIEDVKTWSAQKKQKRGVKGDIETWARNEVQKEMQQGGINIRDLITSVKSPLYMMRVSGATPKKQLGRFESQYGPMPVPEFDFRTMSPREQKEFIDKYKAAKATAHNMRQELQLIARSSQEGGYSEMLRSTARVLAEEQDYIEELLNNIKKFNYDIEEMAKMPITARVPEEAVSKLPTELRKMIKDRRELQEFSKVAGVPMMTEVEEERLRNELMPEFAKMAKVEAKAQEIKPEETKDFIENLTEEYLNRALALIQMDRALKAAKVRPAGGAVFLEEFIPQSKKGETTASFREMQRIKLQEQRERIMQEKRARLGLPGGGKAGAPPGGIPSKEMPMLPSMGGPVPVQVVGVNAGVKIGIEGVFSREAMPLEFQRLGPGGKYDPSKKGATAALDPYFTEVIAGEAKRRNELKRKIQPVKMHKGQASMLERVTASTLSAGAGFGKEMQDAPTDKEIEKYLSDAENMFQAQVDAIAETMTQYKEFPEHVQALAELGTAIHEKVQRRMKKAAEAGGRIERFEEIVPDYTIPVPEEGGEIAFGGIADIVKFEKEKKTGDRKVTEVGDIKTVSGKLKDDVAAAVEAVGSTRLEDIIDKVGINAKVKLEEAASQINAYLGAYKNANELAEQAMGEILLYENIAGGEDEPVRIQIGGFNPERFERDVKAVKQARLKARKLLEDYKKRVSEGEDVPKAERRVIRTTSTSEQMLKAQKALEEATKDLTEEDIDEFIDLQIKHYKRMQKVTFGGGMASKVNPDLESKLNKLKEELRQQSRVNAFSDPENLNKYLGKVPVAAGEGLKSVLDNLIKMQQQAKLFQQGLGFDVNEVLKNMPEAIQETITGVRAGEKLSSDLMEAIDLYNEAADPKQQIVGKKIIDVWKLYKIARGDFLAKQAEQALKDLEDLEASPEDQKEFRKENEAYGTFEKSVKRMQEYITQSLGKRTDIYTFDKRFLFPELAMGAGVYRTPQEIAKSAAGPLGEDEKLKEAFKILTRDMKKGAEMRAPIEKVREVVGSLTQLSPEVAKLLSDSEKLERIGPKIAEAWDFSEVSSGLARLRAALEKYLKFNEELEADQRSNLEATTKYIKNLENQYMNLGRAAEDAQKEWGEIGLVKVSPLLSPAEQEKQFRLNRQLMREYFERPAMEGGAKVGERQTLPIKVVGEAGQVLKNQVVYFHKYDEAVDSSGQTLSKFTVRQKDLIARMQEGNATFRNAIRRVVMWGAASRLIYGGVSNLKSSLDEIANIEMGIAQLRMVMNPLESDFDQMGQAAIGFAKRYGVAVEDVLRGMKVFAQQGLAQAEVLDRTRVATLAANVTTLNAKDATEALTAAMKAFKEEGTSAMRFLDSWSNVEARHAITAEDMANAIKKSAAAAKTAGFTFDELNGIIAGIGTVTRQTGKEVGTSLRFIARRLFSEKGPKALQGLDISVLTAEGENRRAFEVLSDLAAKWKDLTNAQKLNIAQSIGGTRQYNSLIVAMENWDEVLTSVADSTNSKGSAERRNLEVMKTYEKQLQQTKAAFTELKMEIGEIVLPTFKGGLKALRFLTEVINEIPGPIKAAAAGFTILMGLLIKGNDIFSMITETIAKGKATFAGFGDALKKELGMAGFEVLGLGAGKPEYDFLKTLSRPKDFFTKYPAAAERAQEMNQLYGKNFNIAGTQVDEFHSVLGKAFAGLRSWAMTYNEFVADATKSTGKLTEKVGEGLMNIGEFLSISAAVVGGGSQLLKTGGKFAGKRAQKAFAGSLVKRILGKILGVGLIGEAVGLGAYFGGKAMKGGAGAGAGLGPIGSLGELRDVAGKRGLGPSAVGQLGSVKDFKAFFRKGLGFAGEAAGGAALIFGNIIDEMGEGMGALGDHFKRIFATADTGMIKAIAPMAITIAALLPTLKAMYEAWQKINMTAEQYNRSLDNTRRSQEDALSTTQDLIRDYGTLNRKIQDINKLLSDPKLTERRMDIGTYEAPLVTLRDISKDIIKLSNNIAKTNSNLVASYDKLGNAILSTSGSFKTMMNEMARTQSLDLIQTELDALGKYVRDLSEPGEAEEFKGFIKDLAESVPIFGDMISSQINQSPIAVLEEAVERINTLQAVKNRYPLSTAVDEDLKKATTALDKYRENLKSYTDDMQDIYSRIVSPQLLRNLRRIDVQEIFKRPEVQDYYEVELKLNPEFRFIPGATPEDLMGRDYMRAIEPAMSKILEVTSDMTRSVLETLNVRPLEIGTELEPGAYLVTFMKDYAKAVDMAGQQAKLSLKETADDTFEWVITYFDKASKSIVEKRFGPDVQEMVNAIFPFEQMKDLIVEEIDLFDQFLTGAAAGLTGLDKKKFKRGFDLGERFFSQLPTTTLLQSNFGYTPFGGVGPTDLMAEFPKDIQKYLLDPIQSFNDQVKQFNKEMEEGAKSVGISASTMKEINDLLAKIQNNQVAFQFRAELVETMKAMAELEHQMAQSNETIRLRARNERLTMGGLYPGAPVLPKVEMGTLYRREGTIEQRMAIDESARVNIEQIAKLENSISTYTSMLDSIAKARVNVDQILKEAMSKGITLDKDSLRELVEEQNLSKLEKGMFDSVKVQRDALEVQKDMAYSLDELLARRTGEVSQKLINTLNNPKQLASFISGPAVEGVSDIKNLMEDLFKSREAALKGGDFERVGAINQAIDKAFGALAESEKFGFESLRKAAEGGKLFNESAFAGELAQYMGVRNAKEFITRAQPFAEKEAAIALKELSKIDEFREENKLFTSKNVAALSSAIAAVAMIQKSAKNDIVSRLDRQIRNEQAIKDEIVKEAGGIEKLSSEQSKKVKEADIRIAGIQAERAEAVKKSQFYGTAATLAVPQAAIQAIADQLGIKVGTALAGHIATYLGAKGASYLIDKSKEPESMKEFGDKLERALMAAGEEGTTVEKIKRFIGEIDLKRAGEKMSEDLKKGTKETLKMSAEEFKKYVESEGKVEFERKMIQALQENSSASEKLKEKIDEFISNEDEIYKDYHDLYQEQNQEMLKFFEEKGGIDEGSREYKDLLNKHEREMNALFRNMSEKERKKIEEEYPVGKQKATEYMDIVKRIHGPEIAEMANLVKKQLEAAGVGDVSPMKLVGAAGAAATLSNYVFSLNEMDRIFREGSELAAAQQRVTENFIKGLSDADLKSLVRVAEELKETPKGRMVAEMQGLVPEEAARNVKAILNELQKETEAQLAQNQIALRGQQLLALINKHSIENTMRLEKAIYDLRDGAVSAFYEAQYGPQALANRGLAGYQGDQAFATPIREMSTQQRMFLSGSKEFRKSMDNYVAAHRKALILTEVAKEQALTLNKLEETIAMGGANAATIASAKQVYKETQDNLKKTTERLDNLRQGLSDFAKSAMMLERFTQSIYQFNDALQDVRAEEAIEGLKSFQNYIENMDKMMGGGHPMARIPISPEEERMGRRVGMDLVWGQANAMQLEEARIRDQLRTATGQQYYDLRKSLDALSDTFKRREMEYEQRKENEQLRRQLQPFEEQTRQLMGLATAPETSMKDRRRFEALANSISKTMEDATQVMTQEELKSYLKDLRDRKEITPREYEQAMRSVMAGGELQYRGIFGFDLEKLSGLSDDIKGQLEKVATYNMREMEVAITDPVTRRLDTQIQLLAEIAKESGVDTEKIDEQLRKLREVTEGRAASAEENRRKTLEEIAARETKQKVAMQMTPRNIDIGTGKLMAKYAGITEQSSYEDILKDDPDAMKVVKNYRKLLETKKNFDFESVGSVSKLGSVSVELEKKTDEYFESSEKRLKESLDRAVQEKLVPTKNIMRQAEIARESSSVKSYQQGAYQDVEYLKQLTKLYEPEKREEKREEFSGILFPKFFKGLREKELEGIKRSKQWRDEPGIFDRLKSERRRKEWIERWKERRKEADFITAYLNEPEKIKEKLGYDPKYYPVPKKYSKGTIDESFKSGSIGNEKAGPSGIVRGKGTSTNDQAALAQLSAGEFVIKGTSAERFGFGNLEYINETGKLPPSMIASAIMGDKINKYAEGGPVRGIMGTALDFWFGKDENKFGEGKPGTSGYLKPKAKVYQEHFDMGLITEQEYKDLISNMPGKCGGGMIKKYAKGGKAGHGFVGFFGRLSESMGELIKEAEKDRLELADKLVGGEEKNKIFNLFTQAAASTFQIGTTIGKFGVDTLASAEGLGQHFGKAVGEGKFWSQLLTDVKNIGSAGLNIVSNPGKVASGLYDTLKEDLSKGGIGTTAGILSILTPSAIAVASKAGKAGRIKKLAESSRMVKGENLIPRTVTRSIVAGQKGMKEVLDQFPFLKERVHPIAEMVTDFKHADYPGYEVLGLARKPYEFFNESGKLSAKGNIGLAPISDRSIIALNKLSDRKTGIHETLHVLDRELGIMREFAEKNNIKMPKALEKYAILRDSLEEMKGEVKNLPGGPLRTRTLIDPNDPKEVFAEEGAAAFMRLRDSEPSYIQTEIEDLLDTLSDEKNMRELKRVMLHPKFEKSRKVSLKETIRRIRERRLGDKLEEFVELEKQGRLFDDALGAAMGGRIKKYASGGIVGNRPQLPVSPEEAEEWKKAHRARKTIFENWDTPRKPLEEDLSAGRAAREAKGEYLRFTAGPDGGYNVETRSYSDLEKETERKKEAIRAATRKQIEEKKKIESDARYFTAYGDNIRELNKKEFSSYMESKKADKYIPKEDALYEGKWALHTAEAASRRMSPSEKYEYLGGIGRKGPAEGVAEFMGISAQYRTPKFEAATKKGLDPRFLTSPEIKSNLKPGEKFPQYYPKARKIDSDFGPIATLKGVEPTRTLENMPEHIEFLKKYKKVADELKEPKYNAFGWKVQNLIEKYLQGEDVYSLEYDKELKRIYREYRSRIHPDYINKKFPNRSTKPKIISTRGLYTSDYYEKLGYTSKQADLLSEQGREAFIEMRRKARGFSEGGIPQLKKGGKIGSGYADGGIIEVHPEELIIPRDTAKVVESNFDKNVLNSSQSSRKVVAVLEDNKVELKDSTVELSNPTVSLNEDSRQVRLDTTELKIAGVDNGTLKLDTSGFDGDAVAEKIGARIERALSGPNAVGGERIDEVSKTVRSVEDKLIAVKSDLEDRIEMLETPTENSSRINQTLNVTVNDLKTEFNTKLNNLNSEIRNVDSKVSQSNSTINYRIRDLLARLDRINNTVGVL